MYKTFVRPNLDYAVIVCLPQYKKDMIAIENIQRRARKLVSHIRNLAYQVRLKLLWLPSLEYKRERANQIEVHVYKIMNNIYLYHIEKNNFFTTSSGGHQLKFAKKHSKCL